LFLLLAGFGVLFVGGRCLIDGALVIAQIHHIPMMIVALAMVSLATALPEFVFMISMMARRWTDVTLGYLLSSSIFNILGVLGMTATLYPGGVNFGISPDIGILIAIAILLMPLMIMSWRLSRLNGVLLLVGYLAYVAYLASRLGYLPFAVPHF
jgi:cation:H+ antiporter